MNHLPEPASHSSEVNHMPNTSQVSQLLPIPIRTKSSGVYPLKSWYFFLSRTHPTPTQSHTASTSQRHHPRGTKHLHHASSPRSTSSLPFTLHPRADHPSPSSKNALETMQQCTRIPEPPDPKEVPRAGNTPDSCLPRFPLSMPNPHETSKGTA